MNEISNITEASEEELRDMEVPWFDTEEELIEYIEKLVSREHDYGTCVYAMSMSALATYYYVAKQLGVTGFQAGAADLDFIKRSRRMDKGFCIIDFNNLLYPQYRNDFPTYNSLIHEHKDMLREEAKKLLEDNEEEHVHPNVLVHWQRLASN